MEIVPGRGLPFVRIGQTLSEIEAAMGPGVVVHPRRAVWDACSPPFGVHFDADAACDLIEVYASTDTAHSVTLGGVQLVGRPMDDVVEDLGASGLAGRRTCLTVDYDEGFTLWSLGDLMPAPDTGAARAGTVVEGVAIGALEPRRVPVLI